jgi:hypothetical protein
VTCLLLLVLQDVFHLDLVILKCSTYQVSTNSDKEKTNVLADFFTSVFTIEGDGEMPDIEKDDVPPLETMIIIKDKVKKVLFVFQIVLLFSWLMFSLDS